MPLSSLALHSLPQFPLSTRGCVPPPAPYSPAGTNATFLNTPDTELIRAQGSTSAPTPDAAFSPITQVLVPMEQAERERKTQLPPLCPGAASHFPPQSSVLILSSHNGGMGNPKYCWRSECRGGFFVSRRASFIELFALLFFFFFFLSSLQCVGRHTFSVCRKAPGVLWGARLSLSLSYPLGALGCEADPQALSSSKESLQTGSHAQTRSMGR